MGVPPANCPCQEGAGQNCHWQKDNAEAEGANHPSQVDVHMCQDGSRKTPPTVELKDEIDSEKPLAEEVDTLMLDLILNAAQYKSGVPQNCCEAMCSPKLANGELWRKQNTTL